MAKIHGIEGLSEDQIKFEIQQGAKFVVFQYCISVLIMTFKRGSDIHFIRKGEGSVTKGIGYTLISFVFGWWGIPWGPIYTISSIFNNMRGGKDITREVLAVLDKPPEATV